MAPTPPRTWLGRPLIPDALVARVVQGACFVSAPALLVAGITASARLGTTPGEILLGVLASGVAALLLTTLGVVLPLAAPRPDGPAPDA